MAEPVQNRAVARALCAHAEHLRAQSEMLRLVLGRKGWTASSVSLAAVQALSDHARELARRVADLEAADAKSRVGTRLVPLRFTHLR